MEIYEYYSLKKTIGLQISHILYNNIISDSSAYYCFINIITLIIISWKLICCWNDLNISRVSTLSEWCTRCGAWCDRYHRLVLHCGLTLHPSSVCTGNSFYKVSSDIYTILCNCSCDLLLYNRCPISILTRFYYALKPASQLFVYVCNRF